MLTIRCSSLDRAMTCSGSLAEPKIPYNPNTDEAREGTAGHEALAKIVIGEIPDIEAIAAKHDIETEALAELVGRGKRAWEDLRKWFPNPATEIRMSDFFGGDVVELRGTADVLASSPDTLAVLDWKFGWAPSEHTYQLLGYADLAVGECGMPTSGHVLCCEVWVRAGEIRVRRYDMDALADFDRVLISQVRQTGKQYGPGLDACRYCPHQTSCQARDEWMRSSVTALTPVAENQALTPAMVGSLYERAKMLGKALDRYDEVLKAMLAQAPVPLPDGRKIVLEERQQDKVRPSKAMPYLREGLQLTPDEADEILSVSKGGIERVVKARAPKGKGAAAVRETMAALAAADAVEEITKRQIKVVA